MSFEKENSPWCVIMYFVSHLAARADAARFLIEQGAPAGVYDVSGTPCLSLMIEKMPQIAIDAVEQFHLLDRAFRKHYYYLSYLERDPKFLANPIPESKREQKEQKEREKEEKKLMKEAGGKVKKKEKTYAKTPLEVCVGMATTSEWFFLSIDFIVNSASGLRKIEEHLENVVFFECIRVLQETQEIIKVKREAQEKFLSFFTYLFHDGQKISYNIFILLELNSREYMYVLGLSQRILEVESFS